MSEVKYVSDFNIPIELVGIYARSLACQWVGNGSAIDYNSAATELMKISQTEVYAKRKRLGILKIYLGDTLVGFSLPRVIKIDEHDVFQLNPDDLFYRIGTVFIDEEYRGRGIMKRVLELFIQQYKNVVWTCDVKNHKSQKAALAGGLTVSHNLYFKSKTDWSYAFIEDHVRHSLVFKTKV